MNKVFHKFSVVIPILNESKNLKKLTDEISKYLKKVSYEIIFIDDNSSDNTSIVLKKIQKHNKRVRYYIRKKNPDLSQSCILGFQKASFDNIFVMDGDLQHDPKYLMKMIKLYTKENLDFVIGARDFSKKSIQGLSTIRFIASKILINIFFLFVGQKTIDPMSGFFIFKKKIYKKNKNQLFAKGYKILSDLIYVNTINLKIKDFVIKLNYRKKGNSKMNFKVLFNLIIFIGYNFLRKIT
jgi:dolichol-phosphate mannosyltransferase